MGRRKAAWVVLVVVALLCVWLLLRRGAITAETAQSTPVSGGAGQVQPRSRTAGIADGVIPGLPSWFGQKGVPPRRIAGRVTYEGKPYGGAEVRLSTWVTRTGNIAEPVVRTGPDGRFDFGLWPPWTYWVDAQAPGLSPDHLLLDLRDLTKRPPSDDLELRLGPCYATLYGSVRDASGGMIMGAKILVTPSSPNGLERGGAVAISEAKGAYEMCVPMGFLQIEVGAESYGSLITNVYAHGRTRRDLTLIPEAIIVGKVVHAEDNTPVVGASVGAWPLGWGRVRSAPRMTTTDANGRFRLTGVAAGRHRLQPVGDELAATGPVDVVVEAGHTSAEIVLRLARTRHINGIVVERGSTKPVAGATVGAWVHGGFGGGETTTLADGTFRLAVPSGTLDLHVEPWDLLAPKTITVEGQDLSGLRLEVDELASVRGRVTHKGEPVAGAKVTLGGTGGGHQAASDVNGRYEIKGLPPGTYAVGATSPRHEAFGNHKPEEFKLGPREQRDGIDIELEFAGSIAGVVVDQKGAPVSGVWVEFDLIGGSDSGSSGTNPDGSFVATQMTGGGDYRPMVRPSDASPVKYPPATGDVFPPVALADGAAHVEGVRLQIRYDRMSIGGKVTDGAGKPQADVRVLAAVQEGNQPAQFFLWQDLPVTTTAVDGSFTISELAQGNYTLQARNGDGNTATVRDVPAGKQGVSIVLAGTGGIDGDLVGFGGKVEVSAFRFDQPAQDMLTPTIDGAHFEFRAVPAGRYRVNATGPDGSDAQVATVQPGQNAHVTLRSRGLGTVSGRVVEWRSGAAVAGVMCHANITGESEQWGGPGPTATADDQGTFLLDSAPAGILRVACGPRGPSPYSDGRTKITLANGQRADVQVPVVKRQFPNVATSIQANLDMMVDIPRIGQVTPGGVADKAGVKPGDVIVAVDGLAVDKLSPWGTLTFVLDRAIGSTARLSLLRAGQPVTANVVVASEF